MQPHTDYPELAGLEELVHQHRRLVAGEQRIKDERHQLEYKIEAQLRAAETDAVKCRIKFKNGSVRTFEVRRAMSRDHRYYATVAPVKRKAGDVQR